MRLALLIVLVLASIAGARAASSVPTAPSETCEQLKGSADHVVCALTPEPFFAVGGSYVDFTQITDEEVRDLIASAVNISPGV